ncbi:MAG: cardiolipin hydrolase [Pirellulaceae bacterium]
MDTTELDKILKHTLSDFRVSRTEKRILTQIIDELDADANDLAFLRHRAFELARDEIVSPDAEAVLNWLEEINKVLRSSNDDSNVVYESQAFFSPGDHCLKKIRGLFKTTVRRADVCVFTITDDRISDVIKEAHDRGVKIRIITDNDKANDRGSDIYNLGRAGIEVRVDQTSNHMHHKFAIFDHKSLLTGSYNWTRSAASYNEENIIVSRERELVNEFSTEFNRLWKELG